MERVISLERVNAKERFVAYALGISDEEWGSVINQLLQGEGRIIVEPERFGFTLKELEGAIRSALLNEGPRPMGCTDIILFLWMGQKGRKEITVKEVVVICVLAVNMINSVLRPALEIFDRRFISLS